MNLTVSSGSEFHNQMAVGQPRAILKDSLSSLVPKEGSGRALSQAPDSEEETEKRRAFVLLSEAESKRDKKWCS